MAQNFDVVYPPRDRATFDGGKNNKYPRSTIEDNESPDCIDVVFSGGAVETRGGTTLLNTTAIGTMAGDGLYTRHDNTGAETMVAFCKGSAWALTGASTFTTIPSAQSVFTAGFRVGATEYENHMFMGNGGVSPYKYDGTYFTSHGVPAPTATATVSAAATGLVEAGDWVYCYTYVNSAAVQGDIGPKTATFTVSAGSGRVSLSAIGIAPQSFGVSSRRIYRATSTVGPFKLVGTIADNTTTSFVDNIPTASLSSVAPTDNGVPPNYSVAVQHQNRIFCNSPTNLNYVHYSDAEEPYTFGALSFIPIGDASFDLVRGLAVYQNGIIVQCDAGLYLIDMPTTTPTDWRVIKILSQYGSKSPFGSFLYDNKLMVPAVQNSKFAGFAAVTGASVDPERTYVDSTVMGSDRKSDRIEPDMFSLAEAYVPGITAIVFKNKAYVALPYGTSVTANSRVYMYDFSHSQITKQGYAWAPLTGITAVQFTVYAGKLYYIDSAATGKVYQMETTSYNDSGSAINSYFWTKEYSGNPGHENLQKDFRKVRMLVDQAGPYYMNLTYRTDSDSGAGTTIQVSLNPGSAVWGTAVWASAVWGSGADQKEVTVGLGQVTGKRIQFRFSNQNAANQRFKVHGINFTYNIKGKR